jgi:acyl-CoA thioester hydrolase
MLRVRYHETDQQGIVFHARYLEYIDVAFTEYLRYLGWRYDELKVIGFDPAIVRTGMEFSQPARFNDDIQITVMPKNIGRSSFTMAYQVARMSDRTVVASAETTYVNIDSALHKSRPIPEDVRVKLFADAGMAEENGSGGTGCEQNEASR